jgi:NitT/TauT family transport system substrate-binding protein
VPVRYGELGQASDAGYYIALARGYFAEEGLDIQPVAIGSGGRMIPSLGAGQIDVGGGGISTSLINALIRDVPLRLVADKGSLRPGFGYSGLIVRKELVDRGTVQGLADLRGRRIAVNTATGMDIMGLNAALERGGLKLDDVTLEEIAYPDMIAALANGAVDGATPLEPTVSAILQQGVGVQLIGFDEVTPNSQLGAIMYAPQFMRDQPEAAQRFALAYLRGIRDYNQAFTTGTGRDDVIQILTKATTIKDPRVFEGMTLPGLNPNGYLNTDSIVATQAFWQRQGLLQTTVEPERIVDHRYMDYALDVLGRLP